LGAERQRMALLLAKTRHYPSKRPINVIYVTSIYKNAAFLCVFCEKTSSTEVLEVLDYNLPLNAGGEASRY
jgi:hypothetical protein